MKTLDELERITKKEKSEGKKVIAVGMATCGISAGARPVSVEFVITRLFSQMDMHEAVEARGPRGVTSLADLLRPQNDDRAHDKSRLPARDLAS